MQSPLVSAVCRNQAVAGCDLAPDGRTNQVFELILGKRTIFLRQDRKQQNADHEPPLGHSALGRVHAMVAINDIHESNIATVERVLFAGQNLGNPANFKFRGRTGLEKLKEEARAGLKRMDDEILQLLLVPVFSAQPKLTRQTRKRAACGLPELVFRNIPGTDAPQKFRSFGFENITRFVQRMAVLLGLKMMTVPAVSVARLDMEGKRLALLDEFAHEDGG